MGMTMTQKILAAHAGLDKVVAGKLINATLDIDLGTDITTPVAVNEFKKAGFNSVFDKDSVCLLYTSYTFKLCSQRPPSYALWNFELAGAEKKSVFIIQSSSSLEPCLVMAVLYASMNLSFGVSIWIPLSCSSFMLLSP